ncbi:hypothetical protein O5D80_001051 [Batrachochytrium dendrobatidis]|nr:hypothetical protein O5D80_001051 [Batrachochytrium dendrobatidis]
MDVPIDPLVLIADVSMTAISVDKAFEPSRLIKVLALHTPTDFQKQWHSCQKVNSVPRVKVIKEDRNAWDEKVDTHMASGYCESGAATLCHSNLLAVK